MPPRGSGGWLSGVTDWWFRRKHGHVWWDERTQGDQPRFRVICISREAGAGGSTLARMVGRRLGWEVYDQELVDTIAERMGISREDAKVFDELAPTMVQAWALPIWEEHYAPHETYLDHLEKLVDAVGEAGEAVIVGRGAGFCLPREMILSVRVIAPLRFRAARLGERQGLTPRTARRVVKDLDKRRDAFARLQLGVDPLSPRNYDLVLDSESLGFDIAAEILVKAVEAGRPEFRSLNSQTVDSSVAAAAHDYPEPADSSAPSIVHHSS